VQSSPLVGFGDDDHIIRELMRFIKMTSRFIKMTREIVITRRMTYVQVDPQVAKGRNKPTQRV
jgi:hypothetical protein